MTLILEEGDIILVGSQGRQIGSTITVNTLDNGFDILGFDDIFEATHHLGAIPIFEGNESIRKKREPLDRSIHGPEQQLFQICVRCKSRFALAIETSHWHGMARDRRQNGVQSSGDVLR